jgi:transposase
MAEAINYALGH